MANDNNAKTDDTKNPDKMTRKEAGQLGGEETSKTHDKAYYEKLGHEGGEASSGKFADGGGREKDKQN